MYDYVSMEVRQGWRFYERFRSIGIVFIFLVMLSVLTGCGKTAENGAPAKEGGPAARPAAITVSAAASMQDAMNELKDLYIKERPEVTITYNFASSGSLQKQIENGAEVDLFISAAQKQMDELKGKGLIDEETRKDLLGNRLVLIVPKIRRRLPGLRI
jgi:molybdate transport system substrate-binding protein